VYLLLKPDVSQVSYVCSLFVLLNPAFVLCPDGVTAIECDGTAEMKIDNWLLLDRTD
jgi:hypothetical protein